MKFNKFKNIICQNKNFWLWWKRKQLIIRYWSLMKSDKDLLNLHLLILPLLILMAKTKVCLSRVRNWVRGSLNLVDFIIICLELKVKIAGSRGKEGVQKIENKIVNQWRVKKIKIRCKKVLKIIKVSLWIKIKKVIVWKKAFYLLLLWDIIYLFLLI